MVILFGGVIELKLDESLKLSAQTAILRNTSVLHLPLDAD